MNNNNNNKEYSVSAVTFENETIDGTNFSTGYSERIDYVPTLKELIENYGDGVEFVDKFIVTEYTNDDYDEIEIKLNENYVVTISDDVYRKEDIENKNINECSYNDSFPKEEKIFNNLIEAVKYFNDYKLNWSKDSTSYYFENISLRKLTHNYKNANDYENDDYLDNQFNRYYDLDKFQK